MRAMVLNDGETYTGVAGCRIIDLPDALLDSPHEEAAIIAAAKHEDPAEIAGVLAEAGVDGDVKTVHTFDGDEATCVSLTEDEAAFIEEGLNYLEENGAPGMPNGAWRPGTQRMERMRETIERKLGI